MTAPPMAGPSGIARAARCLRAAAQARSRRAPASAPACGLEDSADTLRCAAPAGHSGSHVDRRTGRRFEDTLTECIGDAGAYWRDGRGRAVPIDDAF